MTKGAKLFVLLGMLTFALFNYPFLKIFNRNLCLIEDIPVLIYYLFGAWLLAIVILLAGRRFLSS
jgi:hypothetical protein